MTKFTDLVGLPPKLRTELANLEIDASGAFVYDGIVSLDAIRLKDGGVDANGNAAELAIVRGDDYDEDDTSTYAIGSLAMDASGTTALLFTDSSGTWNEITA